MPKIATATKKSPRPRWNGLSEREQKLLVYLYLVAEPVHLAEMQLCVFGEMESGTSVARNTLRRLADRENYANAPYVRRVDAGEYQISRIGVRQIPDIVPMPLAKGAMAMRKKMLRAANRAAKRADVSANG